MGVCVCLVFNKNYGTCQETRKYNPYTEGGKRPSKVNIPEETQTLDLLDINIKLNYLNTFIDEVSNH